MSFKINIAILVVAFAIFGEAPFARAQIIVQRSLDGAPAATKAFPVGWQRGQKNVLIVDGQRLAETKGMLASAGLQLVSVISSDDKQAKIEIEVAPDAPLGPASLHLLCKAGLSNPKLLRIDDLPQAVETEDNHRPELATPLTAPIGVSGWLGPADVDYFRFEAAAGQRLAFDVAAQRLGSALRPSLALFDGAGRELAHSTLPPQHRTHDERLVHTFAATGAYLLKLIDHSYLGADFAIYHLRIGDAPAADYMFPLGGRRGAPAKVEFGGGNLAAPLFHEFDVAADAPQRLLALDLTTPTGLLSAPAHFALGDFPEVVEREPNQDPAPLVAVDAPAVFNGRIDVPGDRDGFKIRAAQATPLVVRVLAGELGSPLDAVVSIVDANGAEVANVDDRPNIDRSPPVVRPVVAPQFSEDPLIEFRAPADGEYTIFVSDLIGQGGPAYGYRLEVAPLTADFELIAQPSVAQLATPAPNPNAQQEQARVFDSFAGEGAGALSMDRGGAGVLAIRILREGNVGPIAIGVEGLPPGVRAVPLEAAPGQSDVQLNFIVDFEAPSSAAFAKVIGVARVNDREVRRSAVQPVFLSAIPNNGAARVDLATFAIGVSQQGAELAVRGELATSLALGGKTNLKVSLRRREGFAGEVACLLTNVPAGFVVGGIAIPPEKQEAEIEIEAGIDAVVGPHSLLLQGTMPAGEGKPPIVAFFPIQFDLLPLVALELSRQQIDLTAGGETIVPIKVLKNAMLASPIELSLAPLPQGVTAETLEIPPGADEFSLVLKAAPDAATSPIRRIVQIKAKTIIGERTLELPSLRFAIKVAKP